MSTLEIMTSEVFVITGGGTGMGRDLALRLGDAGHGVVIVGRRYQPLADTASAAARGTVETVVADVSTVEGAQALRAAVGERPLSGIVTAAGGQGDFRDGDDGNDPATVHSRWSRALDKNFYSALMPVETLIPSLSDHRGRVVLISSTAALDGQGGPYAAAKAALIGYGMDLARRLGPRGITANVVAPGFVANTGFFEAGGFGPADDRMTEHAASATLVGRVGTPQDVTHVVIGLLDEHAGWTTGQVVSPNGGSFL